MEQRLGRQDKETAHTVGIQNKSFRVRAEDEGFIVVLRAIADLYGCPRFDYRTASSLANQLADPARGGVGKLSSVPGLYCLDNSRRYVTLQEAAHQYQETIGNRVEEEEPEGAAFMQRVQVRADAVPPLPAVQTGGTVRDEEVG